MSRDFTKYDAYIESGEIERGFLFQVGAELETQSLPLQPTKQDTGQNPNQIRPEYGQHFAQGDFSEGSGQQHFHHPNASPAKFFDSECVNIAEEGRLKLSPAVAQSLEWSNGGDPNFPAIVEQAFGSIYATWGGDASTPFNVYKHDGMFPGSWSAADASLGESGSLGTGATRLYFQNIAAPAAPSASARWNGATSTNRRKLAKTKSGALAAYTTVQDGTFTQDEKYLVASFVSDPLAVGSQFAISDTFSAAFNVMESLAELNAELSLVVKVMASDNTTQRVLLYDGTDIDVEWGTTHSGRVQTTVALQNAYITVAGDYLVIEVGFESAPTAPASFSPTLSAGIGANLTGIGTTPWTNPGNITELTIGAMPEVVATVEPGMGISQYLRGSDFGFTIPETAIIDGIEVTVRRRNPLVDEITFVAATTGSGDGTTSVTINKPAGTVAGDVMLAFIGGDEETPRPYPDVPSIASLSGWTPVEDVIVPEPPADSPRTQFRAFVKVAGASEPASYTFTESGIGTFEDFRGVIVTYRGVSSTAPIHDSHQHKVNSLGDTIVADAVATTKANCQIVCAYWSNDASSFTWTPEAPQVERSDSVGIMVADEFQAAAGAGNSRAGIGVNNTDRRTAISIALAPAAIIDESVRLRKGASLAGTDKASAAAWADIFGDVVYGGAADLWGTTWTPADINASAFGAVLAVSGGGKAEVDHVEITVYNTIPSAADTATGSVRYGGTGDDLPLSSGEVSADSSGWVEFSNPLQMAGETTPAPVYDLRFGADFLYAALGTAGLHRQNAAGVWTHYNDVEARIVRFLKGRVIVCSKDKIYEITASGVAPAHIDALPAGWVFTSMCEGGAFIYASAVNLDDARSRIYAYGSDTAISAIEPKGSTPLPRGELVYALETAPGNIFIGTGHATSATELDPAAKDPVLYQAFAGDSSELTYQVVALSDEQETGSREVSAMTETSRGILAAWQAGDGFTGIARYDLDKAAFSKWLCELALPQKISSIVQHERRTYFAVPSVGVFYEDTGTLADEGELVTSMADWNNAGLKSWDFIEITHPPLPAGSSIDIYYTTIHPESEEWTLVGTSDVLNSTGATFLIDVTSRYFTLRFVLHGAAELLTFSARSNPAVAPELEHRQNVLQRRFRILETDRRGGGDGNEGPEVYAMADPDDPNQKPNPDYAKKWLRRLITSTISFHEADVSWRARVEQVTSRRIADPQIVSALGNSARNGWDVELTMVATEEE